MSHISKGKRQYLCELYSADELAQFRRAEKRWSQWIVEAINAKPIKGFTQLPPDTGYYSGCRRLSREVDNEIVYSIGKLPDRRQYLDVRCGKHRGRGTINTAITDDGNVLAVAYDPAGNILAYDTESDMLSVKVGQLRRESSMPGVIYTDHAVDSALLAFGIDQLADLNVADTYPKTISVTDEANLDRLLNDIKSAPGA